METSQWNPFAQLIYTNTKLVTFLYTNNEWSEKESIPFRIAWKRNICMETTQGISL
jgi:hypothetical protein